METRIKCCVVVNSTPNVEGVLVHPEGLSEDVWQGRADDSEAAVGGYLDGDLDEPIPEFPLSHWERRTPESLRMFREHGQLGLLAYFTGAQVTQDLCLNRVELDFDDANPRPALEQLGITEPCCIAYIA